MPKQSEYIGVYEYARIAKRDVTHIYKLIYAGKIAAEKVGKRGVWRIKRSVLDAALDGPDNGRAEKGKP